MNLIPCGDKLELRADPMPGQKHGPLCAVVDPARRELLMHRNGRECVVSLDELDAACRGAGGGADGEARVAAEAVVDVAASAA